jgi:hypothetical protein
MPILKTNLKKMTGLLLLILLFQIANSQNPIPVNDYCKGYNIDNIAIQRAEIDMLTKHFSYIYKNNDTRRNSIPDSFYIDACFLNGFNKLLLSNGNYYDGFRFFFGTNEDNNIVRVFVVPTIRKNKNKHKSDWHFKMPTISNCQQQVFINFNNDYKGFAKPRLKHFSRYNRQAPFIGRIKNDSLSRGIWFDKCVMKYIVDTINNNPDKNLTGINIFNAAYMGFKPYHNSLGQHYPNQSTVVITFVKKDASGNIFNAYEIGDFLHKLRLEKNNLAVDGLNHGQLCPQICN